MGGYRRHDTEDVGEGEGISENTRRVSVINAAGIGHVYLVPKVAIMIGILHMLGSPV
jgi:hypothetical protein